LTRDSNPGTAIFVLLLRSEKRAGRGDRTLDLPLTKRLPCHLAIPAMIKESKALRQPGVEPGAKAWEASMLPIHHWRRCGKRQRSRLSIPVPADCEPTALPIELHPRSENNRSVEHFLTVNLKHTTCPYGPTDVRTFFCQNKLTSSHTRKNNLPE
jgi:hypothetical protein